MSLDFPLHVERTEKGAGTIMAFVRQLLSRDLFEKTTIFADPDGSHEINFRILGY